jgi:hypothetical protein
MAPENVVLYLRISNDPDGLEKGITNQRADGEMLCKRTAGRSSTSSGRRTVRITGFAAAVPVVNKALRKLVIA